MADRQYGPKVTFSSGTLVAGALGGTFPESVLFPLHVMNVRQKVDARRYGSMSLIECAKTVVREEGFLRGLYGRAYQTCVTMGPLSNALYFVSYDLTRQAGLSMVDEKQQPLLASAVFFLSGAAAELGCSCVQAPVELIRSRQMLQAAPHLQFPYKYGNVYQAFRSILRSEGWGGLYASWRPGILNDCSYSALQFLFYEEIKLFICKRKLERHVGGTGASGADGAGSEKGGKGEETTPAENLFAGFVAGAVAGGVTNPFGTVLCRMQTEVGKYKGPLHCMRAVYRQEGLRGFATGVMPRMLWWAPYAGLQFMAYEYIKKELNKLGIETSGDIDI